MFLNSRTTFPLVLEHELCTNAAAIITIIPPSIMFLSELLSLDSGHLRWLLPGKGWSCLETFAPYFWLLLLQCSICLTSGLHWVSRAVLHRARTFNDVCKCKRSLNKTLGGRRENKHGDFVEWKNKLETDKHGDFKGSTSDVHLSCLHRKWLSAVCILAKACVWSWLSSEALGVWFTSALLQLKPAAPNTQLSLILCPKTQWVL